MSGLEILGFILGTTGPIEQGIYVLQWLLDHKHNFKRNPTTIKNLSDLYEQNRDHLQKLKIQIEQCQAYLSQQGMETFNTAMSEVKQNIQSASQILQKRKDMAENNRFKHFFKATNIAKSCDEAQQLLNTAKQSLLQLNSPITGIEATMSITNAQAMETKTYFTSSNDAQTKEIQTRFQSLANKIDQKLPQAEPLVTHDRFKPRLQRQHYNNFAKPNFQTANHSIPITVEAQVKQHLLMRKQASPAIIAIQGEAGVGKTTVLHMITFEPEIQTHFEDGIYYMILGADASTDTAIQQLRNIVRSSGGVKLSEDNGKWSNVPHAIDEAAQWFGNKRFLLLIDDVWDTPDIPNILEDVLSQVVLASPHAAAVFTTRSHDIATVDTTEMVLPLLRKIPESRESRELLLRYARYPEDSLFEVRDEEAIAYILKRTAGLPVAHSVAGKAVASYKLKENNKISPWVWYMHTHNSIVKSPNGRYSSLQVIFSTSLQALQLKNISSSTPNLTNFHTKDYMRMHRSLCVFEKQQWILIPVLVRLWALDQSVVRNVCEEFVKVGLVECCDKELEDEGIVQGIMIHDLLHDFATEEATNHETVKNWHYQLSMKYAEDLEVSPSNNCYSWWKLKDADHGYVMKNLFRHFLGSECKDIQMKYIVSRPEWIQSQLVLNGITQYEKDVSLAAKQERQTDAPNDDDMNDETLRQILEATKLSYSFILNNPAEVWFQLYARLMSLEESCDVKEYLKEIEEKAPRPWLKPVSRCLTSAEGGIHQLIYIKEEICCTVVVPGKHELVYGCCDGWIVVVDLEKAEVKRKWKGHDEQVSALCVSPGGRFIVSGHKDRTVKFWDCETGRQLWETMSDHSSMIMSVAVSRDERTVYTSGRDGTVRLWSIATGVKRIVMRHDGSPYSFVQLFVHVLADDNLIVGYDSNCRREGHITKVMKISIPNVGQDEEQTGLKRIWNKVGCPQTVLEKSENGQWIEHETTLECAFEVTILQNQDQVLAISEDGTKLVTKQENGNMIIWNGTSMMRIGFVERLGKQRVASAEVSISNGSGIALLEESSVVVYDANTTDLDGTYRKVGRFHLELSEYMEGLHFIGNGSKLVVLSSAGLIRVLNAERLEFENERQIDHVSGVTAVIQTPEGKYFVTGHGDGNICLWDTCTGEQSGTCFTTPNGRFIQEMETSENGEWIVSKSADWVSVWNLQSRKMKKAFRITGMSIFAFVGLDVSNDGTYVVVHPHGFPRIYLWDISKTKKPPLINEPSLVIRREGITKDTLSPRKTILWGNVWFRNGINCIVFVDDEWIEEWVTSNGTYGKSRESPTSYHRMSREDVFKVLDNSETQVQHGVEEPNRFFLAQNGIQHGRENCRELLARLESSSTGFSYCSMSNTLCVGSRSHPRFFRFYPPI